VDKWQAQQTYWSSFGLPAYDENTVPDDATMPYITYEALSGSLDGQMTVSASLWYRGNRWDQISQKAEQIQRQGNRQIKIDGGYMKARVPASSFANRMDEPSDKTVRRMQMSIEIEFLTNY